MLSDCKVRLGDRVRIIKPHDDEPDTESFINATGTIIDIDENWEYPYTIEFDDERLKKNRLGWLWKKEHLHFI